MITLILITELILKKSFQNLILPSLCENVEQNVSKTDVINSMNNHDDGLFSNQLDQLNQLVNTNDIIVCYIYLFM